MSDGVLIAIITSSTSILLSLLTLAQTVAQKRQEKKNRTGEQLDRMEKKMDGHSKRLDKLEEHSELQYMSLLRLTVMDSDMPMSERLIAGREYLTRGGNGDVKKSYEDMERTVNG